MGLVFLQQFLMLLDLGLGLLRGLLVMVGERQVVGRGLGALDRRRHIHGVGIGLGAARQESQGQEQDRASF
jgi:hypothetical protein